MGGAEDGERSRSKSKPYGLILHHNMQEVVFNDDGRFKLMMTAFGEKMKVVSGDNNRSSRYKRGEEVAAKHLAAVAQIGNTVVQGLHSPLEAGRNLAHMLSGPGTHDGLSKVHPVRDHNSSDKEDDNASHRSGSDSTSLTDSPKILGSREIASWRSGDTTISRRQMVPSLSRTGSAASSRVAKHRQAAIFSTAKAAQEIIAVNKELSSELEDLADAVEVKWKKYLDAWRDFRAPIFETVIRHNNEQERLKAQDPEHVVEPQPELVQLHKFMPFDFWTDRRDKYGFISVLVAPHWGDDALWDSPLAKEITPERFKLLYAHLRENLVLLRYTLSKAERRTTPVN